MSPMDGKHRWMFAVEIAILFHGIFLECSAVNEMCQRKNVLLVIEKLVDDHYHFPTDVFYQDANGTKLCFDVRGRDPDCCKSFDCSFNITYIAAKNTYTLTLKNETLSNQDIVVVKQPALDVKCMPLEIYSNTGFFLNIENCFNEGTRNIRLTQKDFCREFNGSAETVYKLTIKDKVQSCVPCKSLENCTTTASTTTNKTGTTPMTSERSTTTASPTTSKTSTPPTTSERSTTTASPTTSKTSTPPTTSERSTTTASPTTSKTSTTPMTSERSTTTASPTTSKTSTPPTTSERSTTTASPTTSKTSTPPTTSERSTTTASPTTSKTSTPPTTSERSTTTASPTTSKTSTPPTTSERSTTTASPTTSKTSTPPTTSERSTTTASPTTSNTSAAPTIPGINCTAVLHPTSNNATSLESAVNIMKCLSSALKNGTMLRLIKGDIKGMVTKLPLINQTDINIGVISGDVSILEKNASWTGSFQFVQIPEEASAMAVERNGSTVTVTLFPGKHPDDQNSSFVEDTFVGIDMGAEIFNLSHNISLHFKNVDKEGKIVSCRSWDGKKNSKWIPDGCWTNETSDGITCQCSHLTFFAILLSPPSGNISASDFTALTYITSIGCGLSMFFLAVGLYMYFFIRKGKASEATKILMNLFLAIFNLNLSFLVNETISKLGNYGACVTIAAVMNYTLLATFSWFFIEALHLYISLRNLNTDIKHYMRKICAAGWVTPAVVVIGLLASNSYGYMVIPTDDGNSANMCWIPDHRVHQGVNIGYYAVVFTFTFTIFIITVWQIVTLKPVAEKAKDNRSIKYNSFSIMGLLLLLGITWAFAFFSFGPLTIASYYIFTILNSFQGFFLFIYYYNSSKVIREGKSISSSTTATTDTVVISPYQ